MTVVPTRRHIDAAVEAIVIAATAAIVAAIIIVRPRDPDADAYATRSGVEPDLRHCRRGGQSGGRDGCCCNKSKRDLSHARPPLGIRRETLEQGCCSGTCSAIGRRFQAKIIKQIL